VPVSLVVHHPFAKKRAEIVQSLRPFVIESERTMWRAIQIGCPQYGKMLSPRRFLIAGQKFAVKINQETQ